MAEPIGVFTGKQCTGYGDFSRIDWISGNYPPEGTKLYAEPQPEVSQRERYENLVAQTEAAIAALNLYVKHLEFTVEEQQKRIAELESKLAFQTKQGADRLIGLCKCGLEREAALARIAELENQNGAS